MDISRRTLLTIPLSIAVNSALLMAQEKDPKLRLDFADEIYGIKPVVVDPSSETLDFTEIDRQKGLEKIVDASEALGLSAAPASLTGNSDSLKAQFLKLKEGQRIPDLSHLDVLLAMIAGQMIDNPQYLAQNGWVLGISKLSDIYIFSAKKEVELAFGKYTVFANARGRNRNGQFVAERLMEYSAHNEAYVSDRTQMTRRQIGQDIERWWVPIGQNAQRRTRISYEYPSEMPHPQIPDLTGIRTKATYGLGNQRIMIPRK